MNSILNWFVSNWYSIIGFLLALIGAILTIVFYLKGKYKKEFRYSIESTNLVRDFKDRYDRLKITYKEKLVSNFTVTRIKIWNHGKMTINRDDITDINPLIINLKSKNKILDHSVISTTNIANKLTTHVVKNDASCLIQFDFLDHHDGGEIQLLHTGISSQDIELAGYIIGAGKPINQISLIHVLSDIRQKEILKISFRLLTIPLFCFFAWLMSHIVIAIFTLDPVFGIITAICFATGGFIFCLWPILRLFDRKRRKAPILYPDIKRHYSNNS